MLTSSVLWWNSSVRFSSKNNLSFSQIHIIYFLFSAILSLVGAQVPNVKRWMVTKLLEKWSQNSPRVCCLRKTEVGPVIKMAAAKCHWRCVCVLLSLAAPGYSRFSRFFELLWKGRNLSINNLSKCNEIILKCK